MIPQKNLKVTFTVTALVSPEEYARYIGYPDGSPENEMPSVTEWEESDLENCICTYSGEFSRYSRYFRIVDRKIVNVEETDAPFDPAHPPEHLPEMKIKAYIISSEPVPDELPMSACDAITYSIVEPSKLLPSWKYYTEILITVNQVKARRWYDETDPEDIDTEWNGNLFESCYWGSPESALVEDDIAPGGYQDKIECEYLTGVEA